MRSQKTKKEILYSLCFFKYVLILGATPMAVLGRSCVQFRKLVHVRLDFMRVFAIMLHIFCIIIQLNVYRISIWNMLKFLVFSRNNTLEEIIWQASALKNKSRKKINNSFQSLQAETKLSNSLEYYRAWHYFLSTKLEKKNFPQGN